MRKTSKSKKGEGGYMFTSKDIVKVILSDFFRIFRLFQRKKRKGENKKDKNAS